MFNTTSEILIGIVLFALGYAARKFVEKVWPDEAKAIDAVATKYGEAAQAQVKAVIAKAKANF